MHLTLKNTLNKLVCERRKLMYGDRKQNATVSSDEKGVIPQRCKCTVYVKCFSSAPSPPPAERLFCSTGLHSKSLQKC